MIVTFCSTITDNIKKASAKGKDLNGSDFEDSMSEGDKDEDPLEHFSNFVNPLSLVDHKGEYLDHNKP